MAQQAAYTEALQAAKAERDATQNMGGKNDLLETQRTLHARITAKKQTYLPMWQELADRCLPDSANILREFMPGGKRTQWMFDATAPLAIKKYADAKESMICPETAEWHGLEDKNDDLNEIPEVQEYYQRWTKILFKLRYSEDANFTQQMNECFTNDGIYGNASVYIDDCLGRGIRYRSMHIKEMYFAENFTGKVDMFNRRFKYSVRQAMQAFKGMVPATIKSMYDKGDYFSEHTYVHMVAPNEDFREGANGVQGLKYTSHYICWDIPYLCRTGWGYREFPYPVSRFMTVPGDIYARGPASLVLPDIKQLNEMEKVTLRQAQLAGDPIVLLPLDGNLSGFNMQPGALVWGGMSMDGKRLAEPFNTAANFQVQQEVQEKKRQTIQEAFYITLFQILVQTPEMTATEALLRAQEKAQLLMPSMGRTQSEFMTGIIRREMEIARAAGLAPPIPPVLQKHSHGPKPVYVSPLNQAQKAGQGVAIANTLKAGAEIAQFDPSAVKVFKTKDIIRDLAEINGMKTNLLYTADEVKKMDDQELQQKQMANIVAGAPQLASAAKDFSQAQANAGAGAPPQIAPVAMPPGGA